MPHLSTTITITHTYSCFNYNYSCIMTVFVINCCITQSQLWLTIASRVSDISPQVFWPLLIIIMIPRSICLLSPNPISHLYGPHYTNSMGNNNKDIMPVSMYLNPFNANICVHTPYRPKGVCSIWNHHKCLGIVSSLRFILIPMLWV